jgi:hypothetical protein
MSRQSLKVSFHITALALVLDAFGAIMAQEPAPAPAPSPAAVPALPGGIEVLARGPVHEAFATPVGEAGATNLHSVKPPRPLAELPPEEKPAGNVVWIPGYWAWDPARDDYVWVSGTWRVPPPGKEWVPGYWRKTSDQWQWVCGFWTDALTEQQPPQQVRYLPAPPPEPPQAAPGEPPNADSFYVPGHWDWTGTGFVWRAGYWARIEPGYVWVPAHYVWTPKGYLFVEGYWDLALPRRGALYAPVAVDFNALSPGCAYSPCYVVALEYFLNNLFIGPSRGHYYFGNYYGRAWRAYGFESSFLYHRRRGGEPLIGYACWEHRSAPAWVEAQTRLYAELALAQSRPPHSSVAATPSAHDGRGAAHTGSLGDTHDAEARLTGSAGALLLLSQPGWVKGAQSLPVSQALRAQALQYAQALNPLRLEPSQFERGGHGELFQQPRMGQATLLRSLIEALGSQHAGSASTASHEHAGSKEPSSEGSQASKH